MTEAKQRTVADVMTRRVVTLNEEDNLGSILEGMERYGIRHLPVVDGQKLVGLLSHRDVLRLSASVLTDPNVSSWREGAAAQGTFVARVMRRSMETTTPDASVREAGARMVEKKIGCLPVVTEDGSLIGIITEHDVLRELITR